VLAVAQDVDQHVVDAAEQQGVEDQPELAEGVEVVLRPQGAAGEFVDELAAAPQFRQVLATSQPWLSALMVLGLLSVWTLRRLRLIKLAARESRPP